MAATTVDQMLENVSEIRGCVRRLEARLLLREFKEPGTYGYEELTLRSGLEATAARALLLQLLNDLEPTCEEETSDGGGDQRHLRRAPPVDWED